MTDIRAHLAQAFFACAFGIFFFYHSLAAFEVIKVPLPLGGLWVLTITAAAGILGLLFLPQLTAQWIYHTQFVALLAIISAVAAFHVIENNHPFDRSIALENSVKLLCSLSGLYLIGLYLRKDRQFVALTVACLMAMAIITPFLIRTDPFSVLDDDRRRFLGQVASYAWFGNSFVFVGFAAIAWSDNIFLRAFCAILTLTMLALLGARAELFGFALVLALTSFILILRDRRVLWRLLGLLAVAMIALAIAALSFPNILDRYLDMLKLAGSNSWQERTAILTIGFEQIIAAPLLGSYGYHINGPDDQGRYIHNAISMWAEFGLIPFILYVSLSIRALTASIQHTWQQGFGDDGWTFTFFVSSFCVILMIAAKSIYWPLPALAWGLHAGHRLRNASEPPST